MICSKCNIDLDLKYFEFRSDTKKYRTQCRRCNKGYGELYEDKVTRILLLLKQNLKECGKCGEIKTTNHFSKDKSTLTKLTSWCKFCKNKYNEETKDVQIAARREKLYGLGVEDYIKMKEAQKDKCAICKKEVDSLVIDHDHSTGKVRGLLCFKCNSALGLFMDDTQVLKKAISYLKNEQT